MKTFLVSPRSLRSAGPCAFLVTDPEPDSIPAHRPPTQSEFGGHIGRSGLPDAA